MPLKRGIGVVLLTTAAITAAVASAGGPEDPRRAVQPKIVNVGDDFFAPAKLTIVQGKTVKWRWLPDNADAHNVKLTAKHPPGVKRGQFQSSSGSVGVRFVRKFTVKGTYGFFCSLHPTVMKMDLIVKKRPGS